MSHFPSHPDLRFLTRRQFFSRCALGLGSIALASLLKEQELFGAASAAAVNPMASRPPHFPARAKSIIYLFMAGGPSQLELFEHKPALQKYHGEPIPESFIKGRRVPFMDTFTKQPPKLLGTTRKFARYGQSGTWISECLPNLAQAVDEIAI